MDVEEGGEVFIPKELRVTSLPPSFHFYDPVLGIIHEKMKSDRIEYFIKRSQMLHEWQSNTLKHNIMKIFDDKSIDNIMGKNKRV